MSLKDGTTSKNMLSRGLTSLLDSGKNKASSKNMLSRGLTSLLDSGKNKVSLGAGSAAAAARLDVPSGFFLILLRTKRLQLLGLLLLLVVVLLEVVLQASKTHPSPHRNTMLRKDGTTSKNMLPRGLTSLL